jgi:hypothetical protein
MFYGVVYRITCIEDGMCYIGRSKRALHKRWYEHCHELSNCLYLKHAIAKYGKESFTIEAIASSWDLENLKALEVLLIKQENTLVPNGYNLINTEHGNGEEAEATKLKKSKSQTARRLRDATITFNGETYPLNVWADKLGLSRTNLRWRIKHWGVEEALTTGRKEASCSRRAAASLRQHGVTFEGETLTLTGWAKKFGLKSHVSLLNRIAKWGLEKTLMTLSKTQQPVNK